MAVVAMIELALIVILPCMGCIPPSSKMATPLKTTDFLQEDNGSADTATAASAIDELYIGVDERAMIWLARGTHDVLTAMSTLIGWERRLQDDTLGKMIVRTTDPFEEAQWLSIAEAFPFFLFAVFTFFHLAVGPRITLNILQHYKDIGKLKDNCKEIWTNMGIINALLMTLFIPMAFGEHGGMLETANDDPEPVMRMRAMFGLNSAGLGVTFSAFGVFFPTIHLLYTATLDELGMARYLVAHPPCLGSTILVTFYSILFLFLFVRFWGLLYLGTKMRSTHVSMAVSVVILVLTCRRAAHFIPVQTEGKRFRVDWLWIEEEDEEKRRAKMKKNGHAVLTKCSKESTIKNLVEFYKRCKHASEQKQLAEGYDTGRELLATGGPDSQRLLEVLKQLGLGEFADRFHEHRLTYSILKKACDTPMLFNDAVATAGINVAGERLRLFQALAEGEGESTITTTSTAPAPAKGSTSDAADAVDLPGAVLDPPGSVPEPPLKRAVTVHVP
jgi:hypothetical protein